MKILFYVGEVAQKPGASWVSNPETHCEKAVTLSNTSKRNLQCKYVYQSLGSSSASIHFATFHFSSVLMHAS